MEQIIKKYLAELAKEKGGSETQFRTCFHNFLNEITREKFRDLGISIKQEEKQKDIETKVDGIPDFTVYKKIDESNKTLVGYIECKKPNANLEKEIHSIQISKYEKAKENIILTDYYRFILLQGNKVKFDINIKDGLASTDFETLLIGFLKYDYPHIKDKNTLVRKLAQQSFYYSSELCKYSEDEDNKEESFYRKFNKFYKQYKMFMNYMYTKPDFCDIYSQSLVYGLMLARLDTNKDLNENDLRYLDNIPSEYDLLYEFLNQAYEPRDLPIILKRALISIGKNINLIDTKAIREEFSKENEGKQHIAIFLYEDFLQEYDELKDTQNRKDGGVYYTPVEATNFITRGVNELIKTKFNMPRGYLAENVKVLDFACGTGTFLHSVFEEMLIKKNLDDFDKETIKNKIVKDIYGLELLFVPYIISHTMLTRFLKEHGIILEKKERLGIYLANTLDIKLSSSDQDNDPDLFALQKEYEKAMEIKNKDEILAIIGNPPYSNGKSKAMKSLIDKLLEDYKIGLNETKINLDDLYIKFIRFAEWKMENQKQGVIGIITNNSYLDGNTHRIMRKHLLETFDEIYIINLHGNNRKSKKDENIFGVQVGISIIFLVKLPPKKTKEKIVKYFSVVDDKLTTSSQKLDFLDNTKFEKVNWKTLKPIEPYYWFIKMNISIHLQKKYNKFWKLTDIFENCRSGLKSERDSIIIHYNKENLDKVINDFINLNEKEIAIKYQVEDTRDWKVSYAKDDLITSKGKDFYRWISYRPFDERISYITGKSKGFFGTPGTINNNFEKENKGLCFPKNIDEEDVEDFSEVFITTSSIDIHATSGQTYVAPLYLYDDSNSEKQFEEKKEPNFKAKFGTFLKTLNFEPTPENILEYIYAVLYSPIYRKKYVNLLKKYEPSIPFTTDKNIFEKYAKLGKRLKELHLLKKDALEHSNISIKVDGKTGNGFTIEKIKHDDNKTLTIYSIDNKEISFKGITKDIYEFKIGSRKPIEDYLNYRAGKKGKFRYKFPIMLDDIKKIINMSIAIGETIKIMSKLEKLDESYLE